MILTILHHAGQRGFLKVPGGDEGGEGGGGSRRLLCRSIQARVRASITAWRSRRFGNGVATATRGGVTGHGKWIDGSIVRFAANIRRIAVRLNGRAIDWRVRRFTIGTFLRLQEESDEL